MILKSLGQFPPCTFKWESIPSEHLAFTETDLSQFESYEIAYHKLMQELVDVQISPYAWQKEQLNLAKYSLMEDLLITNSSFTSYQKPSAIIKSFRQKDLWAQQ